MIRLGERRVEGGMNEASSPIEIEHKPSVPTGRRLAVVRSKEAQDIPSPDALAEMVGQVAHGRDRQAFALLFGYFGPKLKTFFLRWSLSSVVAEDLVQETMLNVWRKASYFDPERAGVATWVFTIARNIRIDHLRRQRDPSILPPDPEGGPQTLEDDLLGAERDERVRHALTALSMEQQTIIRLSYFSEKSQTEIADELGIPLGTVKSRTRLAMNRLRALLEDQT
ncbi:sigma-70 family RNA polymerase sigma factor [Shinella sp.]|uniref:sigma-70 family RNA polymerase sigma factor n=1 Tax=Shinella sp. TaxID=1870904 RepID=UPI003F6F0F74